MIGPATGLVTARPKPGGDSAPSFLIGSTVDTSAGADTTHATSHTLQGGGSNRCVFAIISGYIGGTRSVVGATLNGVAATGFVNTHTYLNGGDGIIIATPYWNHGDAPGQGTFSLSLELNNAYANPVMTLVECQDIDQTDLVQNRAFRTQDDVAPGNFSDSDVGIHGEEFIGDTGLLVVAAINPGGDWGTPDPDFSASNVDRVITDITQQQSTLQKVWMHDEIPADPDLYPVTGSGSTSNTAEVIATRTLALHTLAA